jgi:hypothetical protein
MLNPHEHIVGVDVEHEADMTTAKNVLHALIVAYPGYEWFVVIKGGVIHIKIQNWSQAWGMCLHTKDVSHDAAVLKRSVVRAAGEFLERANMVRGRSENKRLIAIEGVPDHHLTRGKVLDAVQPGVIQHG